MREACDLLSNGEAMLESKEKYRTYGQMPAQTTPLAAHARRASDHRNSGGRTTPFSCAGTIWQNDRAGNPVFVV